MTTDDFTEAARAAARRRLSYHDRQFGSLMPPMLHMAEWGRDHALAQEPTTAEVQAFQKRLYYRTGTWVPEVEVRAALSAARAARRDEGSR